MGHIDNNYGAGGSRFDEFGELPYKQIESMQGIDGFKSQSPISISSLKEMIIEYCVKNQKKPKVLVYPGDKRGTPGMGVLIEGMGYFPIEFHNMPNAAGLRLEA